MHEAQALLARLHFWHVQIKECVVRPIPLWGKGEQQCTLPLVACPSHRVSLQPNPKPTIVSCKARQGWCQDDVHYLSCRRHCNMRYMVACLNSSYVHPHLLYTGWIFLYDNWEHNTVQWHKQTQKEKATGKDRKRKGKKRTCVHLSPLPSTSSWLPTMYVMKGGERKEKQTSALLLTWIGWPYPVQESPCYKLQTRRYIKNPKLVSWEGDDSNNQCFSNNSPSGHLHV